MLHENPLMVDIDVNHWRNLQSLLLDSAKARRRIILIHQDGEVEKLVHSHREVVSGSVDRVDDPHAVAERLYRDNEQNVDFVAVFERRAFDEYFGRFQATWRADEDLDVFVHRTYELLDEYPDGMVTHPDPARNTLGLQWRIGAGREEIAAAVERFVKPDSSVVLGIFDGDALWATLVLHFDRDLRADVVTTVETSRLSVRHGRKPIAAEVVDWVGDHYGACSVALFTGLEEARAFLASDEKLTFLTDLAARGELLTGPLPEALHLATAGPAG
jgi:hypothetical protein